MGFHRRPRCVRHYGRGSVSLWVEREDAKRGRGGRSYLDVLVCEIGKSTSIVSRLFHTNDFDGFSIEELRNGEEILESGETGRPSADDDDLHSRRL